MATESREYPDRIWAGHLGGGRRIWKPELMHESEKAFACEYVRADVAGDMLEALRSAEHALSEEAENRGDEDIHYASQVRPVLEAVRAAIAKAGGA